MNYKIIEETENSGKKYYYIRKRVFLFIWKYLREFRDVSMCSYKIGFTKIEDAKQHIFLDKDNDFNNKQRKIKSRKTIKYF